MKMNGFQGQLVNVNDLHGSLVALSDFHGPATNMSASQESAENMCHSQSLIVNMDAKRIPSLVVDQSGRLKALKYDPWFPSPEDTNWLIQDMRNKMDPGKFGDDREKAFMDAKYLGHLKFNLERYSNEHKDGCTWKNPQEKHTTVENYTLVNEQANVIHRSLLTAYRI